MIVSASESPRMQFRTADYAQVFEYPIFLSKPDTYKATHELLHYLSSLIPTLNLPLEQEQKLAILLSAVLEERKSLKLKTVDMALQVTASREQMALVKKEQVERAREDEKMNLTGREEQKATADCPKRSSDFVSRIDASGEEAAWMRLL